MKRNAYILFILCLLAGGLLPAQDDNQSNVTTSYIPLNNVTYLAESDRTLSIDDILLKEGAFQLLGKHGVSISKTGAIWLSFQVPKQLDSLKEYFFRVGDFDEITFFYFIKNGECRSLKNGKFILPSERIINKIPVVFPLKGINSIQQYWVRIIHYNANETLRIQAEILLERDFNKLNSKANQLRLHNNIVIGFLGGVLLAFLIYPLIFLLFSKHRYFIYYSLYIISNFFLLIYSSERFSNIDLLFSYYPKSLINIESSIFVFSAICYFMFLRRFTLSIKKTKSIDFFLKALIVYESVLWLTDIFFRVYINNTNFSYDSSAWGSIPIFIGIFFVMYKLLILREKVLLYVVIGIGFVVLGLALNIYFLLYPSYIDSSSLFNNKHLFYHLGIVFELLFFSLALSQANQNERNTQLTNELLLKNQVIELEKRHSKLK